MICIQNKNSINRSLLDGLLDAIVGDKAVFSPDLWEWPCPIHVWDPSSNHVQQIGNFSNPVLYHVDAAEDVLVVFEINREKQPAEVQHT